MKIIHELKDMKEWSKSGKKDGQSLGFVPTMGSLHEGHLSLVREAREESDLVVVSIFVNPTQFGPNEDFDSYPRDTEGDLALLAKENVDVVFIPDMQSIYPTGYRTYVEVELLTDGLCGAGRPGHFKGVTTVVCKLFNLVQPDKAFFGRKDYQQLIVLSKMVEDLNMDTEVIGCPIVRERDGIAMSSRNMYLSDDERQQGLLLSGTLKLVKEYMQAFHMSLDEVKKAAMTYLATYSNDSFELEYIEWVNGKDLEKIERLEGFVGTITVAMAARVGKTRLIDNIQVEVHNV
jgi:pantoate--beta-alanine ligase